MRCPSCGTALQSDLMYCPYDGSPLTATPVRDPRVGMVVNERYHILERISTGATATVYRARHRTLPGDIALKILHVAEDRHVARFAREARATSRIDHENVVSVIDFGYADDGFYFLAMEFVSGRLLGKEIERSAPMAPLRAAKLLSQIGGAVGRAHQLGIIHRDIKPDNVMLCAREGDTDFVKVLDFGLARPISPMADLPGVTSHGEVLGTPQYMAPEQWMGAPTDERTDIYAIGVLAYELVTGSLPFGGNFLDLMQAHLYNPPTPPSEYLGQTSLPRELDELVLRALAKDPNDRFASVEEISADLANMCASLSGRRTLVMSKSRTRSPRTMELDPTQLDADTLEMADAPAMCAEIRRLASVRRHRMWQLIEAVWKSEVPFEIQLFRRKTGTLEACLEERGRALTALVSRLREESEATRKKEAELRGRIVDLSLALAVQRQMHVERPQTATVEDEEPTIPSMPRAWLEEETEHELPCYPGAELHAQLEAAEEELAALESGETEKAQAAREKLSFVVNDFRRELQRVQASYVKFGKLVLKGLKKSPQAKHIFAELAEADGAVASYAIALDSILGPSTAEVATAD